MHKKFFVAFYRWELSMEFLQRVIILLPSVIRYQNCLCFYLISIKCIISQVVWWVFLYLYYALQSVDVTKYTDEEYEKYLNDPVGTEFNIISFVILVWKCQFRRLFLSWLKNEMSM